MFCLLMKKCASSETQVMHYVLYILLHLMLYGPISEMKYCLTDGFTLTQDCVDQLLKSIPLSWLV